ncbi:hypothetical protein M0R45_004379 [Rubus argutus]|uniref:RPW8 domain-containing protein n=1 Tax=Rubus argutus TaxID=59490 RepID=A0AAW1YJM0_RUBAR
MVNPGDVFGGAGGGLLFSVLYDGLKELISKYLLFKPVLKSLISTLKSLEQVVPEIVKLNKELDRPEIELASLKTQLEEGKVLVAKCCKVRVLNVYKKYKYAKKLLGWNENLKQQLEMLNVQGIRDGKETLSTVNNTDKAVSRIETSSFIIKEGLDQIETNTANLQMVVGRVEVRCMNLEARIKQIQKEAKLEAWCAVPELPTLTVGLDRPLKELKTLLLNDGVSMVVLSAPGGCGKTTLATKFFQDEQVQDKFKNNMFFVTVSKTPNFVLIVQELYQRKGYQAPTFPDDKTAVNCLRTFLKDEGQNPLLLILDDVWSGSDSVLEKFDFKMPNYKILVTSRSPFPGFGSPYLLQPLDFDNAMELFHHSASLGDRSSHIAPDISRQIVEGCKGFPLAITVAGKSLCGQPTETWEKRLIKWSKGSSILDDEIQLLLRLRSSLESLDSSNEEMATVKECFLDLGSFPEDQRIPVAALIDMWAESYNLLDDDAKGDILCVANLHMITNRSLANLVVTRKDQMQGDGYYSEHFVTQHDLLRELAIYETRQEDQGQRKRLIINITGNDFPKWWREQKYQCMKARLLSISTDGGFSTEWYNMELPEAEILVLNFQTKNYALPQFVKRMVKLKVLVVTNYGFIPSELTNFQLLCSSSYLKRIRLERISIPFIAKNSVELTSLQKISLFMCHIGQAFSSDGSIQLSHAWPNLVEVNIDYCNDLVELPADISDLIHLKKLSITNCHKLLGLPEEIGKLAKLEVLRLRSCTDLETLPASTGNLKKLNFLDMSYCFSIKELPENFGELSSLRKLVMRECSRLQELPLSVSNLEHLEVIGDDETQSLWEPFFPIKGTSIVVTKENINLNWLHKLQF